MAGLLQHNNFLIFKTKNMKNRVQNPVKMGLLLASFMLVCGFASANNYLAVGTGNWSNSLTWNGSAPPFTLAVGDVVTIPLGATVTMDQNVTLNGATLDVAGTILASAYIKLIATSGTISGAGSISAANIMLGSTASLLFTGAITADSISNSIIALSTAAQITFYNEFESSGLLNLTVGALLTAGNNSNITIAGGGFAGLPALFALTSAYTVNYTTSSAIAGAELAGAGLGVVTINMPSTDSVALTTDALLTDSLKFTSGMLKLDGFNLTTSGQITGNVAIAGNIASSIIVNTTLGLTHAIGFVAGFQNLNNLTLNVGTGNSVTLSSDLTVHGIVSMATGDELNISNEALTVMGNLIGTGTIAVNVASKLAFTGLTSITGNVSLSGINMSKFTVGVGTINTVKLATALNVDTLDLKSGTLILNGHNLAVNADIAAMGLGNVLSSSASNLVFTTLATITDSLMFSPLGDTVKDLTMNVGGGGSLRLGSNLVVDGVLNFVNGHVDAGNRNLLIDSAATITGASNTAYVLTSNGGYLTMYDTIGKTTNYAIGTATGYLPATLNLASGSATGTVGLNSSAMVYSHGISGVVISTFEPMVNATWLFQNNIGAGINANMQLSWTAAAEVNGFLNTNYAYISHYSSMWDNIGDSMVATVLGSMYSVTRANITSMSPFAVFNQQTVPTSVSEVAKTSGDFVVYPNPTFENLYIRNTTGITGLVNVEIYNTLGQVVSTSQFKDGTTAIPVDGLPSGTYLIRFYNDNMEVVKKFSKM